MELIKFELSDSVPEGASHRFLESSEECFFEILKEGKVLWYGK